MTKQFKAKSLLVTTLMGLVTTSTLANAPGKTTGFYVGGALGGSALTGDSKFTVSRTDPVAAVQIARFFSVEQSGKGINGDIFAGYGKRFNCFHLGAELFVNFMNLKSKKVMDITNQATGDQFNSNAKIAWGGFLNIGYYIQAATKLYLKLGIESRRFSFAFVPGGPTIAPYIGVNKNYRKTAFVPGFGLETDINHRFAVRAEYRIALHGKSSLVAAQDPANATRYTTAQIKPTVQTFNLGLVVKI